jgi:cell shape-determining protein MreC
MIVKLHFALQKSKFTIKKKKKCSKNKVCAIKLIRIGFYIVFSLFSAFKKNFVLFVEKSMKLVIKNVKLLLYSGIYTIKFFPNLLQILLNL